MILNNNIDSTIKEKLTKLYGDSSIQQLNKLIQKWTSKSFGLQVFGSGFNYEREKQESELSWIDTIEILQQVILDYCDTSSYLIIFDELDEDYRDFNTQEELYNYTCMMTSLFKAVQDIRSIFDPQGKKIFPVVFLRSDIYARLNDSDKNKWYESIIDLEWDSKKIQNMLAHRLSIASNISDMDFNEIWLEFFSKNPVSMGHRQSRKLDIFSYIKRSTEMRPRDFVQYVKECVIHAKEVSEKPISPETVKNADDEFSEYLKRETIDELYPIIPEINEILGLISTIRKQQFSFENFETEYKKLIEHSKFPKRDVKTILLALFDAGVLGNEPTMRGQAIFKFSKKSPRFNFNEPMLVHRGLYKALQIF